VRSDSGQAHPSCQRVEYGDEDGNRDEAQIDAVPLVVQVEIQRDRTHDGEQCEDVCLVGKFFDGEDAVKDGQGDGEERPDSGEPGLRRLMPCECRQ